MIEEASSPEEARFLAAAFEAVDTAIAEISERTKAARATGAYARGAIVCPLCGSEMTYLVAAGNGHIHAKCSTPECIQIDQ